MNASAASRSVVAVGARIIPSRTCVDESARQFFAAASVGNDLRIFLPSRGLQAHAS
jgi:hypothetical protein